jgi:hypothetical protein
VLRDALLYAHGATAPAELRNLAVTDRSVHERGRAPVPLHRYASYKAAELVDVVVGVADVFMQDDEFGPQAIEVWKSLTECTIKVGKGRKSVKDVARMYLETNSVFHQTVEKEGIDMWRGCVQGVKEALYAFQQSDKGCRACQ